MKDLNDLSDPLLLKELFKQLFNNSSDALFITNLDFEFTECNTAFDVLFHEKDVCAKRVYLIDLFERESKLNEVLVILEHEGIVDDYEVTFRDFEGERLYVLLSLVPIKNDDGKLLGYQGIVHDETERVIAQRALQRSQRIAMAGRMLRTIAHEIRNPLTNVNLALSNLKESELNEDDEFMLSLIEKNSNRINNLLSELLNSSKPEELQLKKMSLQDLVNKTVSLAEDRMKLMRVVFAREFPAEPIFIEADERKMTLALNNILINAIEAMPDGGALTLEIKESSKRIRLSIIDTGLGMEEEVQEHLFDPFFTAKPAGTGLGLTATQNILQSHGWYIHVESEVNVGSTFHIKIPIESKVI